MSRSGFCRRVELQHADDQKIPGIFLRRLTELSSSTRVKFAVRIVDRQDINRSVDYGEAGNLQVSQVEEAIVRTYETEQSLSSIVVSCAKEQGATSESDDFQQISIDDNGFAELEWSFQNDLGRGWAVPVKTEETSSRLTMNNKLVLVTHVWLMKVRVCFPYACTALCSVRWASVVWKGLLRTGHMHMASGTAIGPPGGAQLCLGCLQTQVQLSPPRETVAPRTGRCPVVRGVTFQT